MFIQKLIDNTSDGHSRRVSQISALLAKAAGYTQAESVLIAQAALLHDVGKVDIPDRILHKPSSLTPDEYDIMKSHTILGCKKIEEAIRILEAATVICREHHERWDGSGYYRLSGENIHPYARLVAVADVFDALYSKRTYKESWDISRICSYFSKQAGKQFEYELALILLSIIADVRAIY